MSSNETHRQILTRSSVGRWQLTFAVARPARPGFIPSALPDLGGNDTVLLNGIEPALPLRDSAPIELGCPARLQIGMLNGDLWIRAGRVLSMTCLPD